MQTQDSNKRDQAMAFAAINQAAHIVRTIARTNQCDEQLLKVMLQSLTFVDATTPVEIYGNSENLNLGYNVTVNQLDNQGEKDIEVTRYIIGIIALERSLASKSNALGALGGRIDDLNRLLTHFDILDSNAIANIAKIYSDVISPLGRRIQIAGNPNFLQVESTQNKVRALLLCAIRAAVLWRQLGGKRRHLVFSRRAILEQAQQGVTTKVL